MVDVGDDRYVPQIRTDGHAETLSLSGGKWATWRVYWAQDIAELRTLIPREMLVVSGTR